MKQVFVTADSILIGLARNLLQEEGVECGLLNELVSGEYVPSLLVVDQFELWIFQDQDECRARAIIERLLSGETREALPRQPWKCPNCEQMIEGQFTECWHCLLEEDYDPRKDREARCSECGYLLWKLPDRRCPECGADF